MHIVVRLLFGDILMRRLSLLSFVLVAGCASSGSTAANTTGMMSTTRVTTGSGGSLSIQSGAGSVGATGWVPVKPDSAFALLQKAYTDLEVPLTTLVTAERTLGNPNLKVRRKLGRLPMQKYLDCGIKEGIPNAETYEIQMNVQSWVSADPKGGASITTRVQAIGSDPAHGRGNNTNCTSTGEIEIRLLKWVQEHS